MSESKRRNYTVVTRTLERTKREPSAPPPPEEEVLLDPTTSANAVEQGSVIGWRPDADETQPCYEAQPAYYEKAHRLEERANEMKEDSRELHLDNDSKKLEITEQKLQEREQQPKLVEESMKEVVPQHQVINMPTPSKYYDRSFPHQISNGKWASSQPITMPAPVKHYKNESLMQPSTHSYPPEINEKRSPSVISHNITTPFNNYMQTFSNCYPPVSPANEKLTSTCERRSPIEVLTQSPQVIQMPIPVKQFMRPPSAGFVSHIPQASETRSSKIVTETQMINMPSPVKLYKNKSLMQPSSYSYPPEINERWSPLDMPTAVTYYKNEGLMQPPSNAYLPEISQANDRQTASNEREPVWRQPGFIDTPTPVNCYKPSNSHPPELPQTNDVSRKSTTLTDRKWPVDGDHVWNHIGKSAIHSELSESKLPKVEPRVTAIQRNTGYQSRRTDHSNTNDDTGSDECCTSDEVENCFCGCARCSYISLILLFTLFLVFLLALAMWRHLNK